MRLVFRQLPVHEALRDVEHHPALKRAVALQPPGVFVVPHAQALGVPRLELALGIPACNVHIVHAAVVEGGTLVFVPFARCKSRRHVADADDGQFAYLALVYPMFYIIMVPRVAQVQVDGREDGGVLGSFHRLPFFLNAFGNGFLADDVFSTCHGFLNLVPARVGQGKQSDHFYAVVGKHFVFIFHHAAVGR